MGFLSKICYLIDMIWHKGQTLPCESGTAVGQYTVMGDFQK